MAGAERFTLDDAKGIGKAIGIDWSNSKFDLEQFLMGLHVELEHGRQDPATDVTHDDPIMTGKILSIGTFGLIVSAYLSMVLLPPKPKIHHLIMPK